MCIFCKIINNEIPSKKIYEDEKVIAILDISQATQGHTLVIPKKHYTDIFDIEEDVLTHVTKITKVIAKHYEKTINLTDVNILNNSGPIAGQTVNHFHMHIIPRYTKNDIVITFFENSIDESLFNKIKM